MSWETFAVLLMAQIGGMLGVLQWNKNTTERWCRDLFVPKADYAGLQERVRAIESNVVEIKKRTQDIYDILVSKGE